MEWVDKEMKPLPKPTFIHGEKIDAITERGTSFMLCCYTNAFEEDRGNFTESISAIRIDPVHETNHSTKAGTEFEMGDLIRSPAWSLHHTISIL